MVNKAEQVMDITQQISDVIFDGKEQGMSREQVALAIVIACKNAGIEYQQIATAYGE